MMTDIGEELKVLEDVLRQGQRLSMQGSYDRRPPAPEAVPFLTRARDGLREFTNSNPGEAQAWRMLSLAYECLLDYGPALAAISEAMRLSGRKEKRDLKRVANLREALAERIDMPLTPDQLVTLGDYLKDKLRDGTGERNFRWTEAWLLENGIESSDEVLAALRRRGAYSDFQVLSNVVV